MQLSPISLAITRLGGVRFSPSALFSSGEQGAWYDPSDLTTLFQDSAGTTPVTAVEQPVGLVLDKSKGLVLGSEAVTNGGPFTATTGWTGTNATLSVVSSNLRVTNTIADGGSATFSAAAPTIGKWYKVQFTVVARTVSYPSRVFFGGNTITGLNAGTYTYYLYATTTAAFALNNGTIGVSSEFADYANISVKELAGNHAFQSTSASRPTLRARYNLLTQTEVFNNAAWDKLNGVTISQNVAVAPDGTTTADKLIAPNSTGTVRVVRQALTSGVNGVSYVSSFYAKYVSGEFAWIRALGTDAGVVWFDIQNGVRGAVTGVNTTGTITPVGNGWYRCVITSTASSVNIYSYLNPVDADGSTTTTGDGSKGVLIWGAQLTQTAVFPSNTYQRIATATDYAAAGFPTYLFFDGVDDSLLTNSVNFSATDKMTVWAGVTKSSDAAGAILVELSPAWFSNNGAFNMGAPYDTSTNRYAVGGKGTASGVVGQESYVTGVGAAPDSAVLTGTYDIVGDNNRIRRNGTAFPAGTADQELGNFGNYPLYIGRRNNATLPLNGNIYSLIIRGAQSTAGQISSTESWVAAKTPLGTL